MKTYPVWRYHQTLKPEGKIVYSQAQDEALGIGWVDTPAKFHMEQEVKAPVEVTETETAQDAATDVKAEADSDIEADAEVKEEIEATPKRRGRPKKVTE